MNQPVIPTPRLEDIDVVILDAYSLLFRAYHSFPLSLTSPTGEITNAVYGFTRMLLRVLEIIHPKYLVTGTDMGEPTFRHVAYQQYKANREEADVELKLQFPMMHEVLKVLNIPTFGVNGFEADDVIGTLSEKLSHENAELQVAIFTSDRDAFQLVHDNVFVLWPERDGSGDLKVIGQTEVVEKMQVFPNQIVDYKALCGDASDNIPGVRGIGPKTAANLMQLFGSLQRLYAALKASGKVETVLDPNSQLVSIDEVEMANLLKAVAQIRPHVLKKLVEEQTNAWLSQSLARIDTNVEVDFSLQAAQLDDYDKSKALQLFTDYGFESLKKKLPKDEFESAVQESLFGM